MFSDSENEVIYDEINEEHRKIIDYTAYANEGDIDNGHGSHVCGIASGSSQSGSNDYNISFIFF